jgi:hypothetical protein
MSTNATGSGGITSSGTDSVPESDAAQLRETSELRTIREYLLRLRSTKFLLQPAETGYLGRLRLAPEPVVRTGLTPWRKKDSNPRSRLSRAGICRRQFIDIPFDLYAA